jgi:hypothetical protein
MIEVDRNSGILLSDLNRFPKLILSFFRIVSLVGLMVFKVHCFMQHEYAMP